MQGPSVLFTVLLGLYASGSSAMRTQTNPLAKVLELMDGLSAKITKEGEAEEKAYKDFFEWCDDAARTKRQEIKTATAKKEKLTATIDQAESQSEEATVKIEELVAAIAENEANLKNATAIREAEASDFAASEAELVATVDTVSRALTVLEKEMAKNPAFAQLDGPRHQNLLSALSALVEASSLTGADGRRLTALIQAKQGDEDDDMGAPDPETYKSHSGGIVEVLEDLKEKAEEELSDLRKAETNAKHNYAMMKQSLEDETAADKKDLADEKANRASADETKATAVGDLSETTKELADAQAALKLANENCMATAADHEASVKARKEELATIAKAKQILVESSGGAEGQAYSFVQLGSRSNSRLRSRMDMKAIEAKRLEVLQSVKKLAREHHSSALAQLASRISAVLKIGVKGGEDPFAKVKSLINDLISKLEAEAADEASEKAYCDDQMAKTEEKKGELEDDVTKITAKIDKAAAKSATLKASVKQLQDELGTINKQQAEMDKIRQEENAAYTQAKAELEAGIAGVRKALSVLRDYYASKEEEEPSFVQVRSTEQEDQPPMPVSHSKSTGAGGSIIGILEVVESDFAKNLAAAGTQEDDAQAEYDKMTQENKVTRTVKEQDVKYQTKEFNALDKSVADMTGDKENINSELNAVLEYYAKVKERCIAKPETYEERKARRTAEINGLKEALTVLEDETAFVQVHRH